MSTEREILVRLNLKADQYNTGVRNAGRGTDDFKRKVSQLEGGVDKLNSSFRAFKGLAAGGIILGAAGGILALGKAAVSASNDMNKLKLQISAVVAANSDIKNANGQLLQGVEKIRAAQVLSRSLFKELEQDALKSSATVKELVNNLSVALPSAMSNGLNPKQTEKLVVGLTDAMKVLQLGADQAKSEMRALFSGDITNDADLAKALKIRKEDIEAAREQGRLYEFINSKLVDFRAAAELSADSLDQNVGAAQDFGDKLLRIAGDGALDVLTEASKTLKSELLGDANATTGLHGVMIAFAREAGHGLAQLASLAVNLGKAVGWVVQMLGLADKTLNAWAINVNEFVATNANRVGAWMAGMMSHIPGSAAAQLRADQQRMLGNIPKIQADRNRQRNYWEALYAGKDPSQFLTSGEIAARGPGASGGGSMDGYTITGKADPHAAEDRAKKAAKAAKAAEAARRKAQAAANRQAAQAAKLAREADQAEKAAITAMGDEYEHGQRMNDAYEGGHAGSIRNMQSYLDRLKALPKGYKGAAEEIKKIERDLQEERVRATVDAEKKKRDEAKRTAEAVKEAAEAAAAYEQQVLDNQAAAAHRRGDADVEDTKRKNEAAGAELERAYKDQAVTLEEYYRRKAELRQSDLAAETNAQLLAIEADKKALEKRLDAIRHPAEGFVDRAAEAQVQGELQALEEGRARILTKYGEGSKQIARETAQEQGDATKEKVKAGLEAAIDGVFSGSPIDAIRQTFLESAKKGLIDALSNTAIGSKIAGLFGAGGGGGLVGGIGGLLIAGFADLIMGSFKDLAAEGARRKANANTLAGMDPNRDPVQAIHDEMAQAREAMAKEREKTVKFLGLIPMAHTNGFLTPEEQAKFDAIEKSRVAEAQQQQTEATIDKTIAKMELLRRLGKATTDDLIASLKALLASQGITEDKALQLQAQIADLEEQKAQDAEEAAAKAKQAAEEAEAAKAQAAEDAAKRFEDAWEGATDRSSEFFRRFAEAAKNEIDYLKREYDATFGAIARDYKVDVAYGRRSSTEADYDLLKKQMDAKNADISRLLGLNRDDQDVMNQVMRMANGAYINGNSYFANNYGTSTTGMSQFLKALAQATGGGWVSTGPGGNGYQYQGSQLGSLESRYVAANESNAGRQDEIVALRDEIERLKQQADVMKAEVEGGAGKVARDLQNELAALQGQYNNDPAAVAAAKKAQIDAQYRDRYNQLYNQGLFSDRFDVADRNRMLASLEAIRDLQKAQVDQEAAGKPTDANPLPVRVVDMPPAYALPSSYYFRSAQNPMLKLEQGAIQINGSGLGEAELTGAVESAILNSARVLTDTVNRQNAIGGAAVRIG